MKTKNGLCIKLKTKFWGRIVPLLLFFTVFLVYFGVGTDWSFIPGYDLDFYNPLAQSFLQGRLDIPSPATTYDLSFYQGKYYPYWGPLPALLLIPFQLLKGSFIPTLYLNVLFGSFNVLVIYFLLRQTKRELLPDFSSLWVLIITLFFAFGTTHFYLATLSGVWHVAQVVSFLPATLGLLMIFKKKRTSRDYFWSSFFCSLAFFSRLSAIGLLALPVFLWFWDFRSRKEKLISLRALLVPFLFFFLLFCFYNYARFENPLETGYRHVIYHPHFEKIIQKNGIFSFKNIPRNLWFMTLETPAFTLGERINLLFNLEGNSIFFLAPPLLAIFLASPWKKKPYIASLWLALLATLAPILMVYTTGWMQFGYRFSLDLMTPLILLSVFGVKGKPNILCLLGIAFSVWMQLIGINALR